jgi:hypothetical protein
MVLPHVHETVGDRHLHERRVELLEVRDRSGWIGGVVMDVMKDGRGEL